MAQTSRSDPAIGGAVPTQLTHVAMGRRHRAVKDLSRAIDLNPNLADAHYHRGMAYRDMGRMDRALKDFGAAIELGRRDSASPSTPGESPTSTSAHTRPRSATSTPCWDSTPTTPRRSGAGASPWAAWAVTTRRSGTSTGPWSSTQATPRPWRPGGWPTPAWSSTEPAIEDYSRVLDLDPRDTAVLYSRGIARMYVARFESAVEDFEAIIGIEPGNGAARAARGLAREALGTQGGAGEGQAAR